jgi:hypothetical protein
MTELAFRSPVSEDFSADDIPEGYTRDRATGEVRPKIKSGRPRGSTAADQSEPAEQVQGDPPSLDELKSQARSPTRREDRAPQPPKARVVRGKKATAEAVDVPPFRAGPIAKGMNKLYVKTGKIVRVFDPEVGAAMIEATRKESEDDVTVGEAWEEVARVNPRVRKFLLKLISGGAWGQLAMAHMPILLALLMKPAVMKHVPFNQVIASLAEPEDDTPAGEGALPGGMTADDASQVMAMMKAQAAQMGMDVSDEDMAAAQKFATSMMGNGPPRPPLSQVRNQPHRPGPRSKRGK